MEIQKYRKRYNESNDDDPIFEITKGDNWKFEFIVKLDGFVIMRGKIYEKSPEKLTSLGVSDLSTKDPLAKLLLTGDKNLDNENNRRLFTYNG